MLLNVSFHRGHLQVDRATLVIGQDSSQFSHLKGVVGWLVLLQVHLAGRQAGSGPAEDPGLSGSLVVEGLCEMHGALMWRVGFPEEEPPLEEDFELGRDGAVDDEVGRAADHDEEVADGLQAKQPGTGDPHVVLAETVDSQVD